MLQLGFEIIDCTRDCERMVGNQVNAEIRRCRGRRLRGDALCEISMQLLGSVGFACGWITGENY